jgi:hypothetical protein
MQLFRRWLIYKRLLKELVEMPEGLLAKLGTSRWALRDFAWHCAGVEAEERSRASERRAETSGGAVEKS